MKSALLKAGERIVCKTVLVFIYVVLSMIAVTPIGIAAAILSLPGLKKPMSVIVSLTARAWAWSIIALSGCKLSVQGRENIPASGGVCFVSNHVGIFDIVLALALFKRPFGFIAKRELFFIPLLNMWIWLLGGLFIDRKNIRKAVRTITTGISRIKDGSAMIIFPEGTRSKGRGLQPFKAGSFKLATQSGAVIVPVAISGSYDVFEKNYRVASVPVQVVFSPVIETAGLSPEERKQRLSAQVYAVIENALRQPRPEPLPNPAR
ncbi:MAG: 1-acyl-sn-glycerol-3-phosphate acyltransferase [Spirochaetaceae bacterium]|nr:1-acyl-sn-glycerol-3-phosphate acyltransferase [Spirochaetaceae bacterium]